ncbi:MAG: type VI secretion system baseplate subunit TssF [Endozoicomonas sp.]
MPSSDDLNPLRLVYERELQLLSEHLRQFASNWPETAQALELAGGMPSDPDMARLLEGVVWLGARLQLQLDDGYESVCRQMLQLFYPDFLKPVPAMGIVQFETGSLKGRATLGMETPLELVHKGRPYRFYTRKPVQLLPILVEEIVMMSEPLPLELAGMSKGVVSALRINLRSADGETALGECVASNIEFYASPDAVRANELLDLLFSSLVGIGVCCYGHSALLSPAKISWPLFESDNSLLPCAPSLFEAQRLLRDFFLAPELFRFLSLDLLEVLEMLSGPEVSLWFLMDDSVTGLEKDVGREHLTLGCVPAVNLYEVAANPVSFDHTERDVPIVLGQLYPETRVYDVLSVKDVTEPEQTITLPDLFHASYGQQAAQLSWQFVLSVVRDCLQFKDSRSGAERNARVLAVLCLGYDPQAGGLPVSARLRPAGVALPCDGRLLKSTSEPIPGGLLAGEGWQLLSALQLNIRSFRMDVEEATRLRQILSLFVHERPGVSRKLVDSIQSLVCTREIRPCRSGCHYFVSQGSGYRVILDRHKLNAVPASLFLLLLDQMLNFWRPFGSHSHLVAQFGADGKTIEFPVRADG